MFLSLQRHGKGVMTWPNKTVYVVSWCYLSDPIGWSHMASCGQVIGSSCIWPLYYNLIGWSGRLGGRWAVWRRGVHLQHGGHLPWELGRQQAEYGSLALHWKLLTDVRVVCFLVHRWDGWAAVRVQWHLPRVLEGWSQTRRCKTASLSVSLEYVSMILPSPYPPCLAFFFGLPSLPHSYPSSFSPSVLLTDHPPFSLSPSFFSLLSLPSLPSLSPKLFRVESCTQMVTTS